MDSFGSRNKTSHVLLEIVNPNPAEHVSGLLGRAAVGEVLFAVLLLAHSALLDIWFAGVHLLSWQPDFY